MRTYTCRWRHGGRRTVAMDLFTLLSQLKETSVGNEREGRCHSRHPRLRDTAMLLAIASRAHGRTLSNMCINSSVLSRGPINIFPAMKVTDSPIHLVSLASRIFPARGEKRGREKGKIPMAERQLTIPPPPQTLFNIFWGHYSPLNSAPPPPPPPRPDIIIHW